VLQIKQLQDRLQEKTKRLEEETKQLKEQEEKKRLAIEEEAITQRVSNLPKRQTPSKRRRREHYQSYKKPTATGPLSFADVLQLEEEGTLPPVPATTAWEALRDCWKSGEGFKGKEPDWNKHLVPLVEAATGFLTFTPTKGYFPSGQPPDILITSDNQKSLSHVLLTVKLKVGYLDDGSKEQLIEYMEEWLDLAEVAT
ncbi:hypothetical protein HK102_008600, partial [Quaeritorhiza haematococci]